MEVDNMSDTIESKSELKIDDAKPIEAEENEEKPQDEEKKKKTKFWDHFSRYSPYIFLGFPM